jgi:hypothetical protein
MRGRQLITHVCVERDERRRSRSVCSLVSTASSQPRWYLPSSYPHHAKRCVEWTEGRADGTSPQPVRIPTESLDERRAWERLCSQHVGKAFSRVRATSSSFGRKKQRQMRLRFSTTNIKSQRAFKPMLFADLPCPLTNPLTTQWHQPLAQIPTGLLTALSPSPRCGPSSPHSAGSSGRGGCWGCAGRRERGRMGSWGPCRN